MYLNKDLLNMFLLRRAWRYQRGNQNPYIEEERTTQWPKEKVQKEKKRTPLKTGGELNCSWRVDSSFPTSGTRRVNLVTNPMISHEWGKERKVLTSGTYPGFFFVTHIPYSIAVNQVMVATVKLSKWWLQLNQYRK